MLNRKCTKLYEPEIKYIIDNCNHTAKDIASILKRPISKIKRLAEERNLIFGNDSNPLPGITFDLDFENRFKTPNKELSYWL